MTACKRCKTPFNPNRKHQVFCSDYCRLAHHRAITRPVRVNQAATDPGLNLIAAGRMPTADSLTPDGSPAWTWASICRAFSVDSEALAGLLQPNHETRTGPDVGYSTGK